MNLEVKILEAAFNDRKSFDIIRELVPSDTLSDASRHMLDAVDNFYGTDTSATSVDKELFKEILKEEYPKTHGELTSIVDDLGDTSPANVIKEIGNLRKKDLARELAGELLQKADSQRVRDLWKDLQNPLLTHIEEATPASANLQELMEDVTDDSQRILMYPNSLERRLETGARHGNHVVVFARPNVGKTAFVINLVRGLLRDGRRVAYFMNEEPSQQVVKRLVQRITGRDNANIQQHLGEAVKESEELLSRLYIKDLSPGTFRDIYGLTNVVKPDVVVIDQLRNIKTKEDNRVIALEKMAMEARALGKEHNALVISVTQAGDSARNKLVLDDGDIDFSNTGIPATADLIIGIGCNDEYRAKGRRMITIVKNKLGSEHSSFPVSIDEGLAKILSL